MHYLLSNCNYIVTYNQEQLSTFDITIVRLRLPGSWVGYNETI